MSYFLTDIAKEKGITIKEWCEGVSVAESTARWHLKAKRIPDPKCWKRIARFLKIPIREIEMLFREELEKQGRIVNCCVCQAEFYQFNRKRLCGSPDCLRIYDRTRKAERRGTDKRVAFKKLNEEDFRASLLAKRSPKITREVIDLKVKEYLDSGGKITHLAPTIADGLIAETWGENYTAQQRLYKYQPESAIYNDI